MSSLMCLYGSVTGKAQSIAEHIVQTANSKGIEVKMQLEQVECNFEYFCLDFSVLSGRCWEDLESGVCEESDHSFKHNWRR